MVIGEDGHAGVDHPGESCREDILHWIQGTTNACGYSMAGDPAARGEITTHIGLGVKIDVHGSSRANKRPDSEKRESALHSGGKRNNIVFMFQFGNRAKPRER